MVSQFVSSDDVPLLSEIDFPFPDGTHAIGRLDKDSEGLLLLTTDKKITRLIFSGTKQHIRTYVVMVQNKMDDSTFNNLRDGVNIKVKNGEKYIAKPYDILRVTDPVSLYPWATDPRESYPHTWLLITLTEGKFRQVRKMTLAVSHRCLRLIRLSIENINVKGIPPGNVQELTPENFYSLAGIK